MDPRIRQHAEIIADHSVEMEAGDAVIIDANPVAQDLVHALYEVIGDKGAHPITITSRTDKAARRAYLRAHDGDFTTAPHELALVEAADIYITVKGTRNATQLADVDPDVQSEYTVAHGPIRDERIDNTRWVLTQFPASAQAQLAEMSTVQYENFVWDAVTKDWEAQGATQAAVADRLDAADEVRIRSGEHTDIRMSVAGNLTRNDHAQRNLPGGEVFTAPVPDSVEGTVLFDKPLIHQGREVIDGRIVFEDGEVVSCEAAKNEDVLREVVRADEGSNRLGELGIGMNRDIDRFTYNMLFDEKMGDTIHLALGRAYEETIGAGNERNESAVHVDMIVGMSEDSSIAFDGEVVQRDGRFFFEDGFDG